MMATAHPFIMHLRRYRFVTALIALASVLFMQLALASYACPGMKNMDGCEGMDMMQPSLCHAHEHNDEQALDKPPAPQVQPFVPVTLVASIEVPRLVLPAPSLRPDEAVLARATSPPLSIRNCCFRN